MPKKYKFKFKILGGKIKTSGDGHVTANDDAEAFQQAKRSVAKTFGKSEDLISISLGKGR